MIRRTAVLGAGTMGAQIAAQFANAGVPVVLLDVTTQAAADGLTRARERKPDPFFTDDAPGLIRTGSFDDGLSSISEADWIVEAVIEQVEAKQALLERVDAARRPGSIVSSNTSGLSIASLARGRSDDFRRHWLGTHFFNPPRYLPLLELVSGPDTKPPVLAEVSRFCDERLGKNVIIAKDTPGFIANRIAVHGVVRMLHELASGRYTVEEVDAITGPVLGRPKSATLRTIDIAGLDVLALVARTLSQTLPAADDPGPFTLPPFVQEMLRRGWTGEKTGRGFYERRKGPRGDTEIWALDPASMDYRPWKAPRLASLESARRVNRIEDRVARLFAESDRAGRFLRSTLAPTLLYAASVAADIANSIDDCDRAMQWGFGWALGPFQLWDAIGIDRVLDVARPSLEGIPPLAPDVPGEKGKRFRVGALTPARPQFGILRSARERGRVVAAAPGASLVDIGDGVLAVALHSRMNTIAGDTLDMLERGIREACRRYVALVIGTEGEDFSAGADLRGLLADARERRWERIDARVRSFQAVVSAIRYSDVPVVAAASGLALGGGCEMVLHADRVQAGAELYAGLVEARVGLIPAGGGTKEMLARSVAHLPHPRADLLPFVRRAFETVTSAVVPGSAPDARRLGYLREADAITLNRERLMFDAKALALERTRAGYRPPRPGMIAAGGAGLRAALELSVHLAWRAGRVTAHDALIGRKVAWIMSGGSLPGRTAVSESYLLDLEREAFLSLCGEPRTLERIEYTLETGKPLRN